MSESPFVGQALLVGVGSYAHRQIPNLPATGRDAEAIASLLTDSERCGYLPENVELLTEQAASSESIRASMIRLAKTSTADSTVIVYFSGHGGRTLGDGAWRSWLVPRDAEPGNFQRTAISGDEFSLLLSAINSRRLLVVLDSCHAAGAAEFKGSIDIPGWKTGLPEEYYESLSIGSGRVIIASSRETQFSYVRRQGDLSVFTYHLCDALGGKAAVRGDGAVHVLDVFHYISEAVQAEQPSQTPLLKVKDLDLNYAIAYHGAGKYLQTSTFVSSICGIREQIMKNPIVGAQELSSYLSSNPRWSDKRIAAELRRSELEQIQQNLDLFGPDPAEKAARNRAIYSLLRMCVEIELTER